MFAKSRYTRTFDRTCIFWDEDQKVNELYLKTIEAYLNTLLDSKGYVFLRDIYERLGFPVSYDSLFVGWVKGSYIDLVLNQEESGDWCVDFCPDGDISENFK